MKKMNVTFKVVEIYSKSVQLLDSPMTATRTVTLFCSTGMCRTGNSQKQAPPEGRTSRSLSNSNKTVVKLAPDASRPTRFTVAISRVRRHLRVRLTKQTASLQIRNSFRDAARDSRTVSVVVVSVSKMVSVGSCLLLMATTAIAAGIAPNRSSASSTQNSRALELNSPMLFGRF